MNVLKNGTKKYMGKKGIAAILIVIAIAGGYYYYRATRSQEIQYTTVKAARGDITSSISATGALVAVETVDVGTQISGTIQSIYIDYNSVVKKGQLIAEIDSSTQMADVAQYRANVLSAQANLANAKATYIKAQRDFVRTGELSASDLISKAELDAGEASLNVAKAQVAASEASVAQARASLAKAEINLGYTKIYSPVDGVVVAKNVDAGQTVAASYQTPSIAEIARNLAEMQVEVNVDEADIGGVAEGQRAKFTVDAYPQDTFDGIVTQVRLEPNSTDNVVTYTVIVKVANEKKLLMPGMTANVSLILQEKNDILIVPNSAFRFRPSNGNTPVVTGGGPGGPGGGRNTVATVSAPSVYTIGKDKKPVKIEVERGITDGQNSEIISGVSEKDSIITGIKIEKEGS